MVERTERSSPFRSRCGRAPRRAIAMVAVLAATCTTGCKSSSNTFAAPPPPEVTVAHPKRQPVTRYLESTGTTEAYETVDLRARVPGFLEQVNFKPGSKVKQGDLLFVIDRRTYQAAVDRAESQLLADQAALKVAEAEATMTGELATRHAGSEIDRITKLGQRDAAKAAVAAAQASLETAKLDLEFCEVRSPLTGRITKNFVDIGNLVGSAGQSTVLARVVDPHPLYVTIDAPESDVLMMRRERLATAPTAEPGQLASGEWRPVDLAIADEEEFTVHGHIDYVDPTLDPQTGTIRVRARFENEDEALLPGTFVRIRIFQDTVESTVVPDIALPSDPNGRFALVVTDDGKVEARRVKIGALSGPMRVVLEGLSPTDRVVVNGLQRARPGSTVKPTLVELGAEPPPAVGNGHA